MGVHSIGLRLLLAACVLAATADYVVAEEDPDKCANVEIVDVRDYVCCKQQITCVLSGPIQAGLRP